VTTLYEWPPTRSQRAKWALEELGTDYTSELVDMVAGQQNADAYLAIHPLGVVPALKTGAYTMFESVAIVMQLIDEHPEKGLSPAPGSPERATYYQWSVFAAAELDPAIMLYFDNKLRPLEYMRPPGSPHDPNMAAMGKRDFETRAEILSNTLRDNEYLLGSGFSGADIVIGHSCFMATVTELIDGYPELQAYHERLQQRSAYQRAYDS
jgi:glutathione S-transferase